MERDYCRGAGFCSPDSPLNVNSTLDDMEAYCNTRWNGANDWKQLTVSDWMFAYDSSYDEVMRRTCAWGTLHCDAARCQLYIC